MRLAKYATLAFLAGFLAMGIGLTELRFLWVAYQHGGF